MSALVVAITAFIVLFATCDGSPVPQSPPSTTTENEIGLASEIGGETSDKPRIPSRPRVRQPLQPILKSANHEVIPSGTTTSHTTAHFKTSAVSEHTTHKVSVATTRPTQDFKVKSHKRSSSKKKGHVVRIHVGTGQIVFFSGACGPKSCVVKKELINSEIEPGTKL